MSPTLFFGSIIPTQWTRTGQVATLTVQLQWMNVFHRRLEFQRQRSKNEEHRLKYFRWLTRFWLDETCADYGDWLLWLIWTRSKTTISSIHPKGNNLLIIYPETNRYILHNMFYNNLKFVWRGETFSCLCVNCLVNMSGWAEDHVLRSWLTQWVSYVWFSRMKCKIKFVSSITIQTKLHS